MTFYHCSKKNDLKIIVPTGNYKRGKYSGAMVFLSIDKDVHYTVLDYTLKGYLYEVEPVGPVYYNAEYDEYFSLFPCYVKRLIRTYNIHSLKHSRHFNETIDRRLANVKLAEKIRNNKKAIR